MENTLKDVFKILEIISGKKMNKMLKLRIFLFLEPYSKKILKTATKQSYFCFMGDQTEHLVMYWGFVIEQGERFNLDKACFDVLFD